MQVVSFFAGVGGIDQAFENAGFNVVWANEYDQNAAITYRKNFPQSYLLVEDIKQVQPIQVPKVEVMIAGFPCQAFSVAGYRKGFRDERGNMFFQLERIFLENKPQVIFLENVKNLLGHDGGNTYHVIRGELEKAGYYVDERVFNACEYGNLPQNRERIYIVAFKDKRVFDNFKWPEKTALTKTLKDYIDFENKVDDKFYYTREKCGFYDELSKDMTNPDTVYQWRRVYVRENKNNLCPTLTANMGTGGHNVPLVLTKFGIRKLTPRECFNLQGYPSDYKLPEDMSQTHLYKQAGNSVVIPVIQRIAENIKVAVETVENSAVSSETIVINRPYQFVDQKLFVCDKKKKYGKKVQAKKQKK